MVNVVVSVEALKSELHSGMIGGAATAPAALIAMLASLRDGQGNTTIRGLDNTQTWSGAPYPPEQFKGDAGAVGDASLLGGRERVGHALGPPRRHRARHRLPTCGGLGIGDRAAHRPPEPPHPARHRAGAGAGAA